MRGLRATASWDVELRDVHVGRQRTFRIGDAAARRSTVAGVSFVAFAQATMAAVSSGGTRRALRLFRALAVHKTPSFPRADGGSVVLWGLDDVVAVHTAGTTLVMRRDLAPEMKRLLERLPDHLRQP